MKPVGFLLAPIDAHIPGAVVHGVNTLRPECRIEHLAHWRGGRYRESADEVILQAVFEAGLVFVTYDLKTVPGILHRWQAEGRSIPAVALISARQGPPAIGIVVHALVRLFDDHEPFDPAYPVIFLTSG